MLRVKFSGFWKRFNEYRLGEDRLAKLKQRLDATANERKVKQMEESMRLFRDAAKKARETGELIEVKEMTVFNCSIWVKDPRVYKSN